MLGIGGNTVEIDDTFKAYETVATKDPLVGGNNVTSYKLEPSEASGSETDNEPMDFVEMQQESSSNSSKSSSSSESDSEYSSESRSDRKRRKTRKISKIYFGLLWKLLVIFVFFF